MVNTSNTGPNPGDTNTTAQTQTPIAEVYGTPGASKVPQWNATTGRFEWTDLAATYQSVVMVDAPTGVAATDTAAWTTAINTAHTNAATAGLPVRVVPRAGAYAVNASLPTITSRLVSIDGPGSGACEIDYSGTGHCLRVQMGSFSINPAGSIRGVFINGTGNSDATAAGLRIGDVVGFTLDDIKIASFLNGTGLWFDNETNWTERVEVRRVWVDNCAKVVKFTVGGTGQASFYYNNFDGLRLNVNAGQVGFSVENNAKLNHCDLRISANMAGVAPTFFNVQDTAQIINSRMFATAEGGTSGQVLVTVGATAIFTPTGYIDGPGLITVAAGGVFAWVNQGAFGQDPNALASGEETLSRDLCPQSSAAATSSGSVVLTYFTARKGEVTNNVRTITGGTAAATTTLARIGLYTVDAAGNLTLVASTTNDTALWNATNTVFTKAWTSAYTKVAGQRYALAVLFVGTTPPKWQAALTLVGSENGQAPRIAGTVTGQSDLPSSIAVGSVGNSAGFRVYAAITP